jgi:hypothetical protein
MNIPVTEMAETICRRWMRTVGKVKGAVDANFENVRDFSDGLFDELDTLQLDLVADKACVLIADQQGKGEA